MIKIIRKVYVILAFLIFFVASGIAIFFSQGYTYNFSKHEVEKRSVLYVKSYPKGADIYLNGALNTKKTPAQIAYLKPDIYKIEVKKAEYQSWEKQLLVRPNQTIFVEDISLFYENPKHETLKQGTFKEISMSPSRDKILFLDTKDNTLFAFDVETEKIEEAGKDMGNITNVIWSPDGQKILLQFKNKSLIAYYDFLSTPKLELNDHVKFQTKQIVWDKNNSDLLYIIDTKNKIYKFDLSNKKLEGLNFTNVLAIKPEGNNIYYISQENSNTYFHAFNANDKEDKKVFQLSDFGNYEFLLPYKDYFCLLDKTNKKLYLIDPGLNNYLQKSFDNVVSVQWDLYNRLLLLQKTSEISIYDVSTNEEVLINRFSESIKNAFWHKNNNHIFYQLQNNLYVSETDTRDKKNIYELKDVSPSQYILPNKKGNILYHITSSGLVKDTIQ